MTCDKIISMNIGGTCTPNVKGYKGNAVIINLADIDFAALAYDETNPHIVKTLTLKSGKYGYSITQRGAQPHNGTNSAMAQGTYQNDNTFTVSLVIPHDATSVNGVSQPLANGAEVVIILESKSKGEDGKSAFEIIGLDGGLVATASAYDIYGDAGKNDIFTLTEVTTSMGKFLFNTDYEATKLMVEGLVQGGA